MLPKKPPIQVFVESNRIILLHSLLLLFSVFRKCLNFSTKAVMAADSKSVAGRPVEGSNPLSSAVVISRFMPCTISCRFLPFSAITSQGVVLILYEGYFTLYSPDSTPYRRVQ